MLKLPRGCERIIVAPLNWGLGHATRSMAIIDQLLEEGKEVILASDGPPLTMLRERYPQLKSETVPGYHVRYPSGHLLLIVLYNFINVFLGIVRERGAAEKLARKYKPDLIISDSRFGFRASNISSVIVTHQLQILAENRVLYLFINKVNAYLLNRFDICWVPDFNDCRLCGKLGRNPRIKEVAYIGPLSTMKKAPGLKSPVYDLTIVLSGPEPARTKLEKELGLYFRNVSGRVVVVRGTESESPIEHPGHWEIYDRLDRTSLANILMASSRIVSRSGYSSVMDYYCLGKGAEMIPTPGQTEQEYLAEWLDGKFGFEKFGNKKGETTIK